MARQDAHGFFPAFIAMEQADRLPRHRERLAQQAQQGVVGLVVHRRRLQSHTQPRSVQAVDQIPGGAGLDAQMQEQRIAAPFVPVWTRHRDASGPSEQGDAEVAQRRDEQHQPQLQQHQRQHGREVQTAERREPLLQRTEQR